jgi:Zn-dependent protease
VPDFSYKLYMVSVMALPFLLAVTWREALRGYVAHKMGDWSVKSGGRLSANPLNHADPIWTGVLPVAIFVLTNIPILFGNAKPIPINAGNFKDTRKGILYTAIAGPAALFFMVALWAYVFRFGLFMDMDPNGWLMESARMGAFLASFFFVIGMLPIPGLDGGKIVEHFLPYEAAQTFRSAEPYGFFIVIGIFILLPAVIQVPAMFIFSLVASLVGV